MKILHIVGSMDPASGGICQGIRSSDAVMVGLGATREVVSLDDPEASFLGMDSFPVHALGPSIGPWQYAVQLKPWLIANLSRFDVFIINGLWIYPSYAAGEVMGIIRRKNRRGKKIKLPKIFVMPHGMLDPYFQHAPGRKLKAIRNWFYWKLIESKLVNNADGVLFTCEKELLLARKTFYPYHPKKEINVGYGIIPPPAFSPDMHNSFAEKCPGINDEPFLLFISRIHKKKGVDMLINSYAILVKQALADKKPLPKLVIAGPGLNTSFGKEMIELANSYPDLKDLVFFPGMLTGNAKWGALYGCQAFILPSHQENFGMAVVEAMACEKTVLISDQVNIMTEISSGGGAIIATDTLDGTTESLKLWLNLSIAEQHIMGNRALTTFKKYFDVKSSAPFFLKAISN